ncbi:SDR family oxidoreductase [Nocardia gipuzkoensis]
MAQVHESRVAQYSCQLVGFSETVVDERGRHVTSRREPAAEECHKYRTAKGVVGMSVDVGDRGPAALGVSPRDLSVIAEDCPSLRFVGRCADIEALNHGDRSKLRPIVDEATNIRVAAMAPPGREVALVLGGNGFVGAHLVARLTREPGIRKVLAAVRSSAEHTVEQRFDQTVRRYRIGEIDRDKVELVEATPTLARFGLPVERYRKWSEEVDLVFNTASSTDYSASYLALRDDWTKSLLRVLQFSVDAKRKHVTYMGSVGSYFYREPADFQRPDSWWYSGYTQMKWVNGALLRWLACSDTFSVTLCESPYVLGATDVGLDPGRLYSWWRIIEIARSAGLIWDGPGMNYAPVDFLVDVLALNASSKSPLWHILPCNPIPYHNELLAELLDLELVDWDQFMDAVSRKISVRHAHSVLSSNIDQLVRLVNEPGAVLPNGYDSSWCDNRRLYSLYLRNIDFRDVRRKVEP